MIPKTFDEAFTEVARLTQEFEKHEDDILTNKNYQEANVRQDYLDKFFVALGSAYERFLGKTITTTDKQAKVEEKPEVRKAGGVYYTPEYIVRYITSSKTPSAN